MRPKETSPLAIASLILSCMGVVTAGILAIVGLILGMMAKKQIKKGEYSGYSLAQAGVIIGAVVICLWLVIPLLLIGGSGFVALTVFQPWVAATIVLTILSLTLIPFFVMKLSKRKDVRALQKLAQQNQLR